MTILTKPSIIIKKPDVTKSPLVVDGTCDCNEEKVDVYPSAPQWRPAQRSSTALLCMTILAVMVAIVGMSCGLMLYRQYLRSSIVHRYQGYCSIPIDTRQLQEAAQADQLIEPNYREHRVLPLWSSEPFQVISTVEEDSSDELVNSLREELDIGDRVEKIRVRDNGRTISFIHDFDDNVTGIIDNERCFIMDLNPDIVLTPDQFVFGIEQGDEFDVSRVRSTLRAVLPALLELTRQARVLAERCSNKPTYRLEKEEGVIIRKRSADAPPHDYIQFSGRHVLEIQISNLADLLEQEKA